MSGATASCSGCKASATAPCLGGTLDDALGEAYDKAGAHAQLSSATGGGPVSRGYIAGQRHAVDLPVPMKTKGLRLFVCRSQECAVGQGRRETYGKRLEMRNRLPDQDVYDPAASFQSVAIEHVEDRLKVAFKRVDGRCVADASLGRRRRGERGVARRAAAVASQAGWRLVVPPPRLCTDNGVMVAWSAIEKASSWMGIPRFREMIWPVKIEVGLLRRRGARGGGRPRAHFRQPVSRSGKHPPPNPPPRAASRRGDVSMGGWR